MSNRLVDTFRVRQQRSKSQVESVSIESIFPPYSSDTESETSSASNESPPRRFYCYIDTLFPPARSPSQSPPRISFSIETFFPPARSPSQSDGSENYEELFPIDPFISTSSRRTRPIRQTVVLQVTMERRFLTFFPIMKGDHTRKKSMRIAVGLSGVESATIKGQDKDKIEVKGEGIDTVKLATLLRKKVGHASIVSVAEEKKEEKEDEKKDELKIQYMVGRPSCTYYEIPRYDTPSCSIM